MGTWIAHLRVAENLLPHLGSVDEVAFAYGSLAPDSGLPNADWSAFDPPKEVTHFLRPGEDEGRIKELRPIHRCRQEARVRLLLVRPDRRCSGLWQGGTAVG